VASPLSFSSVSPPPSSFPPLSCRAPLTTTPPSENMMPSLSRRSPFSRSPACFFPLPFFFFSSGLEGDIIREKKAQTVTPPALFFLFENSFPLSFPLHWWCLRVEKIFLYARITARSFYPSPSFSPFFPPPKLFFSFSSPPPPLFPLTIGYSVNHEEERREKAGRGAPTPFFSPLFLSTTLHLCFLVFFPSLSVVRP